MASVMPDIDNILVVLELSEFEINITDWNLKETAQRNCEMLWNSTFTESSIWWKNKAIKNRYFVSYGQL